eukprot:5698842-Prymnesium_polylepis.1
MTSAWDPARVVRASRTRAMFVCPPRVLQYLIAGRTLAGCWQDKTDADRTLAGRWQDAGRTLAGRTCGSPR